MSSVSALKLNGIVPSMHKLLGISKKAEQFIRRHIKRHQKVLRMKHSQAVAVALHEARDKGYKIPPKKKRRLL